MIRAGSSIAAANAKDVIRPTPGMVIRREHTLDARDIFFISALIAAIALSMASRAAKRLVKAAFRPGTPPLTFSAASLNADNRALGYRPPAPETIVQMDPKPVMH